ncbi:phosphohistidine phosphatase SixA [Actinoalloteichus hoggarensis]|uniref:Uncharacterized protein n=1 Tax=Actinoalloteichus hoggarensis TaxID=1470176 RepID=A0A221W102_9PSEU|nr:hypothetical protein AHOG_09100 [Actinoalloteichus hoggarensis]MBB5919831.1 phosphohistidine phosphatase SixA [Actinoalloteichus hoggarensis]
MGAEVVLVRHAESIPPRPGASAESVRPLSDGGLAQAADW